MKCLRLFIPIKALDAFLYGGHLFAVLADGAFAALPISVILQKLPRHYSDSLGLLEMAFARNDWMENAQARATFASTALTKALRALWAATADADLSPHLTRTDWFFLDSVQDVHLQDFRLYAMRVYLGTRSGTFEARLRLDNGEIGSELESSFQRVYDATTLGLSARAGEVAISAGDAGLFHGTISDYHTPLRVNATAAASRSVRTAWSGFDILNYENHNAFTYLKNRTKTLTKRPYLFLPGDDSAQKIAIRRFGIATYSMASLLHDIAIEPSDVAFAFNTTSKCFFVLTNGSVVWTSLDRESAVPRLRHRLHTIARVKSSTASPHYGRVYGASAGAMGTVIEYFDKVVLLSHNELTLLHNSSAISVRVFPTSNRFRRIVLITTEDGIFFCSVLPDSLGAQKATPER